MSMHIYAFGSICRGEVSFGSDIDLLAIVDSYNENLSPTVYSIYSYKRLRELWEEGNPFAWHLSLESRLLFASNAEDFLHKLGAPATYRRCRLDCEKFLQLFLEARHSATSANFSRTFDLSTMFLGIRNFATCYSLGMTAQPNFSRNAALKLGVDRIPIADHAYGILERARVLGTRGYGPRITESSFELAMNSADAVETWMNKLTEKISNGTRI